MEAALFDAVFNDPFCSSFADFTPVTGDPVAGIRIVKATGDQESQIFGQNTVTTDIMIEVRASEIAAPAKGDRFAAGGVTFEINAKPKRDMTRGIWQCGCFEVT